MIFLLFNGRITGISGIVSGVLSGTKNDTLWRLVFLFGVVISAFIYQLIFPESFTERTDFPISLLISGAFLVGFGAEMGKGCTSGHGICGIARLSKRSITATMVFMTSGIISVYLVRHLFSLT